MTKANTIVRVTDNIHTELSNLMYSEGNDIKKKLNLKRKLVSFNDVIEYLLKEYKEKGVAE